MSTDDLGHLWTAGVTLRRYAPSNNYTGKADALVAAGLCDAGQFPGQPGMRKTVVTIFADGTMPAGVVTTVHRQSRAPGAKRITKAKDAGVFTVAIFVTEDEQELRWAALQDECQKRMAELPRPRSSTASLPTPHLRLVWSAPIVPHSYPTTL